MVSRIRLCRHSQRRQRRQRQPTIRGKNCQMKIAQKDKGKWFLFSGAICLLKL